MKKITLILALSVLTQAAFAVVVNGSCTTVNSTAYIGSQQVVCTNGYWAPVARVGAAAAVGAAIAGENGGTVNNTLVRSPTVVAPGAAAGAPAARAAARTPGNPASRSAARASGGRARASGGRARASGAGRGRSSRPRRRR